MSGHERSMVNEAWFTSKLQEWETPQTFFSALNNKFKFNIDVCASPINAKCKYYFTKEQDGLKQDWIYSKQEPLIKGRIFMNPPFREVGKWFKKVIVELDKDNCELVVTLTSSRSTEAKYFQEIVLEYAHEIWLLTPRIKYFNPFEPEKVAPPFGSMICIFNPQKRALDFPVIKGVSWKEFTRDNSNNQLSDFLEIAEVKT